MPILGSRHMRRLCLGLVLVTLLLAGCARRSSSTLLSAGGGKEGKDLVVFLGDSLTAGYGVMPQYAYPSVIAGYWESEHIAYRVRNAGISGDTTSGVLLRLDRELTPDTCFVFLEIGANDLFGGQEIAGVQTRLDEIVTRIQAKGIPVALAYMNIPAGARGLGSERASAFNQMYSEVSEKHKIQMLPYFTNVGNRPELWLNDGMHLNEQGNRIIARDVLAFLNPAWKFEP